MNAKSSLFPGDRRLNIFVHRASELLTDHEPHGDGLICFSLLNGLAERGHRIFAYADYVKINSCNPGLQVHTEPHRSPANSLISWEHARRAERWLQKLNRTEKIDLVWRMQPIYGTGYPNRHRLPDLPLVIGPIFYSWPDPFAARSRPRFGLSLNSLTTPASRRGWDRAHGSAAMLITCTAPHARALKKQYAQAEVMALPLIVDPPPIHRLPLEKSEANVRSSSFLSAISCLAKIRSYSAKLSGYFSWRD